MTPPAADCAAPSRAMVYRVLPFALFMAFIGVEEGLRLVAQRQGASLAEATLQYFYAVRALGVGLTLYLLRDRFPELRLGDLNRVRVSAACALAGVATFLVWINLPAPLPLVSAPTGFDPALFPEGGLRTAMVCIRVTGAVIVVPVMEELFWRSFLLRYLIDPDFESVPLGRFTWGSFLVTVLLFGLEHHLFLAGMVAGAVFNLILYRTRSLAHCVLAHAVTNLALALYVLHTGSWRFW